MSLFNKYSKFTQKVRALTLNGSDVMGLIAGAICVINNIRSFFRLFIGIRSKLTCFNRSKSLLYVQAKLSSNSLLIKSFSF